MMRVTTDFGRKTAVFPPITLPLLILLVAAVLRLYGLGHIPPGLTHDEADHGLTAWRIVNGVHAIYFTIGYGREPFYDYATAVLMAIMGPTYLAGRLTAVFFSLLLLAAMYAWVRRALGRPLALLTLASLATSFWPLMTARQSLRSATLPVLFVLAVFFFWQGLKKVGSEGWGVERRNLLLPTLYAPLLPFITAGLFLGVSFYTYIPARVLWGVVPATAVYLTVARRQRLTAVWLGVALTLLVGLLIAAPLLLYLRANPGTEVRIGELQAPLTAAASGDLTPLWRNLRSGLQIITIKGDPSARYNLPYQPLLPPLMGFFFYLGLLTAVWQVIRSLRFSPTKKMPLTSPTTAVCLALLWLLAGLSPSLITGAEWSMTQAIGMQPVLYLFPALGVVQLVRFGFYVGPLQRNPAIRWGMIGVLWGLTAVFATNDYFNRWANDPHVRVQYEATMVAAMHYLNQSGRGDVAISTITPSEFHTPALAQITLNSRVTPHWFDGRSSLLLPKSPTSTLILPGFTPLPAALAAFLPPQPPAEVLPLRPTDLDRPLTIYQVDGAATLAAMQNQLTPPPAPTRFGTALALLGYGVVPAAPTPGSVVQLLTLWQVERPLPHAQLFAHLLGQDGAPIAQADLLGVPGETWQPGDYFLQLHELWLGEETAVGSYTLAVGLYTTNDKQRTAVWVNEQPSGDLLPLTPLSIVAGNQ